MPPHPKEHALIDISRETQPVSWHILGAGAMGCLWAARIWQHRNAGPNCLANPPVTLLLRSADAQRQWQEHEAITIRDETGIQKVPVAGLNLHETTKPIDNLLLCTKSQDAQSALRSVLHLLHPKSRVLLLQNGIKAQREIARAFPELTLFCLSTSHGAYRKGPFDVVHAGCSDTYLGCFTPHEIFSSEPNPALLCALPVEVMHIHWDRDITKRLWTKFAINCAINALTVVYDCRNGDLLTLPAAVADLASLCAEIEHILASVPEYTANLNLTEEVEKVLRATAENFSSTLQDVRLGRPIEIDYFNPYLCELAQTAEISCAVNNDVMRRFYVITNGLQH